MIPTPIWKVSYRLDLSQEKPFLQGWATVDNDSDMDWEQVELALVTGKPVSFIQNLYAPYHLRRPTLPLAIVGIAEAKTYDSGTNRQKISLGEGRGITGRDSDYMERPSTLMCLQDVSHESEPELSVEDLLVSTELDEYGEYEEIDAFSMSDGQVETAQGRQAGDQFEFTIKTPVSLACQQSAMLSLVEGAVHAEKMQKHTRKNVEAAGSKTQQGQGYLVRLAEQDTKIDELHKSLSEAEQAVKDAKQAFNDYIHDMYFE